MYTFFPFQDTEINNNSMNILTYGSFGALSKAALPITRQAKGDSGFFNPKLALVIFSFSPTMS